MYDSSAFFLSINQLVCCVFCFLFRFYLSVISNTITTSSTLQWYCTSTSNSNSANSANSANSTTTKPPLLSLAPQITSHSHTHTAHIAHIAHTCVIAGDRKRVRLKLRLRERVRECLSVLFFLPVFFSIVCCHLFFVVFCFACRQC